MRKISDYMIATLWIVGLSSIFWLPISLGIWASTASCAAKYSAYGETSYGLIKGCMVHRGGKWIPVETIREVPQ